MSDIWNSILDALEGLLSILHNGLEPVFGVHSWGWSIVALTVLVRVVMLPLAIKQTRSMRAMQELSPKLKAIQKKYPTDRDMLRTDPEKYRARKAKVNEETMALYKEAGVNPAASCLPLVAQMPIFFALFSLLRDSTAIANEPFYFFTSEISGGGPMGLGASGSAAGWPAWILIVAMALTMFVTQKQMMGRNPQTEGMQAQQQKIIMYVMPVMMCFFGFNLPLGVLLYWVTTNLWQMVQQYIIYRDVGPRPASSDDVVAGGSSKGGAGKGGSSKNGVSDNGRGSTKKGPSKKRGPRTSTSGTADASKNGAGKNSAGKGGAGKGGAGKGRRGTTKGDASGNGTAKGRASKNGSPDKPSGGTHLPGKKKSR